MVENPSIKKAICKTRSIQFCFFESTSKHEGIVKLRTIEIIPEPNTVKEKIAQINFEIHLFSASIACRGRRPRTLIAV